MDNAARTRQRVLALFLPIAAVLYISAEALSPKGTDQVITTTATALKVLPSRQAPGSALRRGLAGASRARGPGRLLRGDRRAGQEPRFGLATVAALIGGLGAFCGASTSVLVYPNLAAAATAHVTRGAAARFLVTTFNSGFGHGFATRFHRLYVAAVLMGYALWRSRSVPRWLAVLFVIGLYVAERQSSRGAIVVQYMLPFAAAMVLLAARIWQAAALPASQPQPEPASVPA